MISARPSKHVVYVLLLLVFSSSAKYGSGQVKLGGKAGTSVSRQDTNKPRYKSPGLAVDERVSDLLARMTLEEKVGQLSTLLGWEMYEKEGNAVGISEKYKKAVKERKIGMLWATLRADPWTRKTLETGLNPSLAAKATNALQKYAVDSTRMGIPLLLAEECPHGHMAIGTTVFPTSIGQSSTWNPQLIQQMASAIAAEARVQGGHIGYGPVLDLAREPRWSRVEETYGEDPYLNGQMGGAMVRGFQGQDLKSGVNVVSTLKHFTAYGVPEGGHNGGSVNTGIRELYQSYLPPFKEAVDAGALSIMTAYNSIDGVPCTAHPFLLKNVLREQWGFKGFTVSDLGSIEGLLTSHKVAENGPEAASLALNAGLDADLGGNGFDRHLIEAVKKGTVSAANLDTAVARVLSIKFRMGLFENPYVKPEKAERLVRNAEHINLAREVAKQSIVLLKNEKNLLPLSKEIKSIAVIGPNADNTYNQLGDYTAPQDEKAIVTMLEGIKNKVSSKTKVSYVKGVAIRDTTNSDINAAVKAAMNADVAVVVMGGSSARDFKTKYISTGAATVSDKGAAVLSDMESGEGFDRASLDLLGHQLPLLKAVVKTGKPVVLVMIQGRPLNLNWADANIPAILTAWYPGQEGGNAVADVLFGDYNPAGRLPVSVPKSVGQLPVYYNYKAPHKHDYVEMDAGPLYPFGYGLSYSAFEYTDLAVVPEEGKDSLSIRIQLSVRNSSNRAGDEVVQIYLKDDVSSVVTPVKQLKAFKRVHLKGGEQQRVEFTLKTKDLMILNSQMKWIVEAGTFTIMAGSSSEDTRLKSTFRISRSYF